MIQEGKLRITAKSVIPQILEGHKTFAELAQRYDMSEEEFRQVLARVVNDKDYPRLVKANDKYVAARSRVGKNKISYDRQEVKTESEETEQQTAKVRREMANKLSSIEKQIAESSSEMEQSEEKMLLANAELDEAKQNLELAKQAIKDAEKQKNESETRYKENSERLETLNREKEEIINKIQEIDSKIIFLIAPNYKGAKPDFGTVISAIPMEGALLEDVSDTTLTTEMSAEDIFLFENMEEAKAANEYLKLVTKYFVEDKEYKLLIDSEVLINLLKKQELIEEPDT